MKNYTLSIETENILKQVSDCMNQSEEVLIDKAVEFYFKRMLFERHAVEKGFVSNHILFPKDTFDNAVKFCKDNEDIDLHSLIFLLLEGFFEREIEKGRFQPE